MSPELWAKVSATLDELLELDTAARADRLSRVRKDDPELAREVESLLNQQDTARLDRPPVDLLESISARTHELTANEKIGRFVVRGEIARGGMGAILRVFDGDFGRDLAVKILLPHVRGDADASWRFFREAQLTGRLQHPGIPPIHELGKLEDGSQYFAMKLIEGETLSRWLERADLAHDRPRLIGVFEQICRTLAYAHGQGIVHRDLKPSNVMVGAYGEVQVMDWGLARHVQESDPPPPSVASVPSKECYGADSSATRAGTVIGTPAFMAPEQARGEGAGVDRRSDVFGLGAVLCAMLTGAPPFRGIATDMIRQSSEGELSDAFLSLDRCGADTELLAIAKRCLAPVASDRYPSAAEVADAITAYRELVQEKLRRAELSRERALVQVREERRRRILSIVLAAALALLAIGVGAVGLWRRQQVRELDARSRDLNDRVVSVLDEFDGERDRLTSALLDPREYHRILSDPQPWSLATTQMAVHLEQAEQVAATGPELLEDEIKSRLETRRALGEEDRKNLAFFRDLEDARLEIYQSADTADAFKSTAEERRDEKYERLFKGHGWNVHSEDVEFLADRISKTPLRLIVSAFLDDWALFSRMNPPANPDRVDRLLELSRRLDPHPWRDKFRRLPTWNSASTINELADSLDPNDTAPHTIQSAATLLGSKSPAAARLLRSAFLAYPSDFWLNFNLGNHALGNDLNEAVAACRTAVALRPRNVHAVNSLGVALSLRGDRDGAIRTLNKALELSPRYARARFNLAHVYHRHGELESAIRNYRETLEIDPDVPVVRNGLGAALAQKGELNKAVEQFDSVLKRNPTYRLSLKNKALALRELGRYADAVNVLLQSQLTGPSLADGRLIRDWSILAKLAEREKEPSVSPDALEAGWMGRLDETCDFDVFAATVRCRRISKRVRLEGGRPYQIDLAGDFDTVLRIEDAVHHNLAFNDDATPPDILASRIVFMHPVSGDYRLVVTSARPDTYGAFHLKIRPTGVIGEASVRSGSLTKSSKLEAGRYYVVEDLSLVANQPVSMILESPQFHTRLRLLSSDGKQVLAQVDAISPEKTRISRLDFTPKRTSSHRLIVTSVAEGQTGSFTLVTRRFAASPTHQARPAVDK